MPRHDGEPAGDDPRLQTEQTERREIGLGDQHIVLAGLDDAGRRILEQPVAREVHRRSDIGPEERQELVVADLRLRRGLRWRRLARRDFRGFRWNRA